MYKILAILALAFGGLAFSASPASADVDPGSALRCVYGANHTDDLAHGPYSVLYAQPTAMGSGWVTDACWLHWEGGGAGVNCSFYFTTGPGSNLAMSSHLCST